MWRRCGRPPRWPLIAAACLLLAAAPVVPARAEGEPSRIEWLDDLDAAKALAARTGKPVLVAFVAAWCGPCRVFRRSTAPAREVQELGSAFHWVMVDIDRRLSLARAHEVQATPQFSVLDAGGRTRARIVGALGPAEFRARLDALLAELREPAPPPPPGGEPAPAPPRRDEPPPIFEGEGKSAIRWGEEGYRGHAICFANVGYGPLHVSSQSPLQSLRLGLVPRTPSTLGAGNVEIRHTDTWVNVWSFDRGDGQRLDYEAVQPTLGIAYGLSDTFKVDLEADTRIRFGGVMDGFVQGFHDAFGLDQGGRDEFPRDDFAIEIDDRRRGRKVSLGRSQEGAFASSLALTLQHNVTCGDETIPAISWSVTARTDLGHSEDIEGGEAVDLGGSVALAKRVGDFYGYASLGFAWFGNERFRGIELETTQLSGLLALEWRFRPTTSAVVQYLVSEEAAKYLGPFSSPSHEVTIGLKTEPWWGTVIEVGIIENVITFDNSPDFGFHFGISHRL